MTPNVRRLINELHDPANRDPGAMQATFRRHDSELLP
jgi:hypothetical protein